LRGIRSVFNEPPWYGQDSEFIAVDGAGLQRITHQALGSLRFRVRMTGPGGHSWADFGRPNPVQSMAAAIHTFCTSGGRPGSSFNFGVIRGGMSVNAIPREATAEIDLRSITKGSLNDLENQLKRAVIHAARLSGVECKLEM